MPLDRNIFKTEKEAVKYAEETYHYYGGYFVYETGGGHWKVFYVYSEKWKL